MTDRELMQQALEAMGAVGADAICEASHHAKKDQHKWGEPCPLQQRWHIAYQALRERLARQEQEPGPWQTEETYDKDGVLIGRRMKRGPDCEWEPWLTPPRREWVGLTEEDFSAINQSCLTKLQAATSAESILKEKNA